MSVVINNDNFENEVLKSDRPVLLDFWASWCGPCSMLSPILEEFAEENPEIKVAKVNVDEAPELAKQFNVMSIPTLFAIKNGVVSNKAVGVKTKKHILSLFD